MMNAKSTDIIGHQGAVKEAGVGLRANEVFLYILGFAARAFIAFATYTCSMLHTYLQSLRDLHTSANR
eukprot:2549983-Rhodomonas_salina.1